MEYWDSCVQGPQSPEAPLGWFHLWHLDRPAARNKWNYLAQNAREALDMQRHFELLDWWRATGVTNRRPIDGDDAMDLAVVGAELDRASLGDRAANLRMAIHCFENVLEIRSREAFPAEWAASQNNLGFAYQDLPDGNHAANLRMAIRCFENALEVRTRQASPADWAGTNNNVGAAYSKLPDGDRSANLRMAIRCYENALEVYVRDVFPREWAGAQTNWALALEIMADISDRQTNLQAAAGRLRAAAEVFGQVGYKDSQSRCRQALERVLDKLSRL
jgi:tetratricopeptide (TPR) repeat protein